MTNFEIGDVVRFKGDSPDRLKLIVRDIEHGFASCVSDCEKRRVHAWLTEIELVDRPDPQAELKQAIREVLLSDEFMAKFAAAWMKTPLPLAMNYNTGFEIKNGSELAPMPESEPTRAQSLAGRTLKAIWQAKDRGTQ